MIRARHKTPPICTMNHCNNSSELASMVLRISLISNNIGESVVGLSRTECQCYGRQYVCARGPLEVSSKSGFGKYRFCMTSGTVSEFDRAGFLRYVQVISWFRDLRSQSVKLSVERPLQVNSAAWHTSEETGGHGQTRRYEPRSNMKLSNGFFSVRYL